MKLINIKVIYFAVLRDLTTKKEELLSVDPGTTPQSLYDILQEKYSFPDQNTFKVAINDNFTEWNEPLSQHDTVVFIPPVTGG
ncbi:MAG: molybdopterin converting factor subunit 1 [Gammaproteobacteria bacterium]|jgi:molybdopterin-guanine dinucleotide biosynthesis protein A|nr:molybdopterin converting factor subunit 1 [Gammaproteobacteria bacterium]MBT5216297.1 molybdopterin converting factor subunit 1 [Gammaproteobacteria bacterium]MBT5541923.1 molybdopterin converting factor subunit 1 [Gammaproteobacteria bacterium]MBT7753569.1 molybdopterin converting factor subunit 1 [Gammaproteobacteria bacterium]